MSSVNKVILVGNLGKDPEVRASASGLLVANMSIATSDNFSKDGKQESKTEWHRVIMFGKLAELAQKYLKKGSKIYMEGKLQTRDWTDQSGQKRYTTEIIANQLTFLDSRRDANSQNDPYMSSSPSSEPDFPTDNFSSGDDVPF